MRRILFALSLFTTAISLVSAQSAMPTGTALFRTFMIRVKNQTGTMFAVHLDGKQYWLTAKHIVTGRVAGPAGEITDKTVKAEVLNPTNATDSWLPNEFDVIDPGKDIDIAILVPKVPLADFPTRSLLMDSQVSFGGECSFLGFPFSKALTMNKFEGKDIVYKMPFIKHCYISGIIPGPPTIYVLDGINNPGFSGGPVLYNTGNQQRVVAVISGFMPEAGEVRSVEVEVPNAAPTSQGQAATRRERREIVVLNPGIIFAHTINSVIDAIKKNPIGRPETDSETPPPAK